MGARRLVGLVVLAAALGALPSVSSADTYPPPVAPTEVVDGDATAPPVTDVDADSEVVPPSGDAEVVPESDVAVRPAPEALSTTGADVLTVLLAGSALVLLGLALGVFSRRRRTGPSS